MTGTTLIGTTPRSILLVVLCVAACGGKAVPATGKAEEAAPPEGMAFKDMSGKQRAAFMQLTVVPTMKPLFQEFDAKKFATFNCKTCHGAGAEQAHFDMPNPDLPRLPKPENFMAYAKDPEHAPMVQFMAGKVKPMMAKLLMMSEFDPATNTGDFSCHACHLTEGE